MDESDDDGLCCKRLCIGTRAWRDAHGLPDPPGTVALVEVLREDGCVVPFLMRSIAAVATFVREVNPPLVDVQATDAERPALLAEIRSYLAHNETHALSQPDAAADAATLH